MTDYSQKSYGRNAEVASILAHFLAGRDISMHGPRRLGKTFVLERLTERAPHQGLRCLNIDLAGYTEVQQVHRRLCEIINADQSLPQQAGKLLRQKFAQLINPQQTDSLQKNLLGMDWENYLEKLLATLDKDTNLKWVILIDELPIFLKALHDSGEAGVLAARNFMNGFSRLRASHKNVRWLITGSIGIEPLANKGQYMGALAKFHQFLLSTISEPQAIDLLLDLGQSGLIFGRSQITPQEAAALTRAIVWRSAYYLEELAKQLPPVPATEAAHVQQNLAAAQAGLLAPHNKSSLGAWEEHIRKHHAPPQAKLSFAILGQLCRHETGLTLNALMPALADPTLAMDFVRQHLLLLIIEGLLHQEAVGEDDAPYVFRIPLVRQWWQRYRPQATL